MRDEAILAKLRSSGLLHDLARAAHLADTAATDRHLDAALDRLGWVVDAISDLLLELES
jgi:hypothetical protein